MSPTKIQKNDLHKRTQKTDFWAFSSCTHLRNLWRRLNWNEVSPAPVPACTAGPSPEILPPSVQRRRPSGPPWCSPFQRKLRPRGPPNHRTCPQWLSCPSLLHHPERNHKDLYPHSTQASKIFTTLFVFKLWNYEIRFEPHHIWAVH